MTSQAELELREAKANAESYLEQIRLRDKEARAHACYAEGWVQGWLDAAAYVEGPQEWKQRGYAFPDDSESIRRFMAADLRKAARNAKGAGFCDHCKTVTDLRRHDCT